MPATRDLIIGLQFYRATKFALRSREVVIVMQLDEAERGVTFRQRFIRFNCAQRGLLRFLPSIRGRRLDIPVQKRVAVGHLGKCQSELRVALDGALESFNSLAQALSR